MRMLVIPDIDDDLDHRLREQANANGHSPEEEARSILRSVLPSNLENQGQRLVRVTRELFGPLGGVELEPQPRGPARQLPTFGE